VLRAARSSLGNATRRARCRCVSRCAALESNQEPTGLRDNWFEMAWSVATPRHVSARARRWSPSAIPAPAWKGEDVARRPPRPGSYRAAAWRGLAPPTRPQPGHSSPLRQEGDAPRLRACRVRASKVVLTPLLGGTVLAPEGRVHPANGGGAAEHAPTVHRVEVGEAP